MKAKLCADVDVQLIEGAAFAMYASTSEPTDRKNEKWDELDFEFVSTIGPGNVWVNVFKDGVDLQRLNPTSLGAVSSGSSQVTGKRYCISWDQSGSKRAIWTIDDRVIKTQSLQGWTKALTPYFSYWGVAKGDSKAEAGLVKFAGPRSAGGDL